MPRKIWEVLLVVLLLLVMPRMAAAQTGANDTNPVWSPDGRQIMFISNRDGNSEIYVMAADGSNLHNVSQSPLADGLPAWSPDSQRIVFVGVSDNQDATLYLVDADGGNLHALSPTMVDILSPQWASDGSVILFEAAAQVAVSRDLYFIQPADGRVQRVTSTDSQSIPGSWSPDSQWVAFSSFYYAHARVQWQAVNRVTGQITNLLEHEWSDQKNCCALIWDWSPDSQQIIFALQGDDNLYTVDVRTAAIRVLANVGGFARDLTWSADGQHIIFTMGNNPSSQFQGRLNGLFVLDTISGGVRLINSDINWAYFEAAPDRQRVFIARTRGPQVLLYQLDGEIISLEPEYTNSYGLVWSPDSRFIAASLCVDGDADIYLLDVEKATAQNLTGEDDFSGTAEPSSCAGIG